MDSPVSSNAPDSRSRANSSLLICRAEKQIHPARESVDAGQITISQAPALTGLDGRGVFNSAVATP